MLKVMFVCVAGMSTSLLVEKVNEVAKGKGMEIDVFSRAETEARSDLNQADVILLGPQVRYLESSFREGISGMDIKLGVVDMVSYGRMDGAAVLKQIEELIK
ncbi:PTS system cellobiose-specific IIB component [Aequitasia blattaphilus]|uniref:PTS sugar transporter subunit IIB n=1 Tax=Aequitasia blattaphilus TaxID=2949332 RepID=A0ABT1E4U7_9FIRM|nr:PTS sugar transporter subunit IIB [Aequitasia blattaphilus]MCP1100865.1 PTS sugar transporter subunit IIB [Aequitasia blattaphilus]MCR8613505.1 PTS sugar transporter subunit IIB [Aequitasia blattaphilus]